MESTNTAGQGNYEALIFVSFGGPEGPEDVMPFLENVTRGRGVPRERLLQVAEQYKLFDGVSPINAHNRAVIAALEKELAEHGPQLPIYFGNRNWHPFLSNTVAEMAKQGIRRALAFVTSAYSSYSGCRQYREDIERACADVGESAPTIDKLRAFWNHPGFIEPVAENVRSALSTIPQGRRRAARIAFTAHSLPLSMAETCDYRKQLLDAADLVAARLDSDVHWELVYQSRSGPPSQPWLEPDIVDHLRALARDGARDVVVSPIGFVADHMEVLFDLDVQARRAANDLGLHMVRAATVGTDPRFISMIRELVLERLVSGRERRALGSLGPRADVCPPDCCPPPRRPAR
jgi:ferrochelatase